MPAFIRMSADYSPIIIANASHSLRLLDQYSWVIYALEVVSHPLAFDKSGNPVVPSFQHSQRS